MFLIYVVCGMLATYRITYDYTRKFQQDDGSVTYLHGPFNIYTYIRTHISSWMWLPSWVRENHDCFYCMSFWAGFVFALLTFAAYPDVISYNPVVSLARLFLLGTAYSAPTIWWVSRNRLMFEASPGSY